MGSSSKTKMDIDSDSDSDSIETTSVLLGYAEKEPTGDTSSHLGGEPVTLPFPFLHSFICINSYESLRIQSFTNS